MACLLAVSSSTVRLDADLQRPRARRQRSGFRACFNQRWLRWPNVNSPARRIWPGQTLRPQPDHGLSATLIYPEFAVLS